VVDISLSSQFAAAVLGFSSDRPVQSALPWAAYSLVITETSDSSAGSMFQVRWSFCVQVAPASSSVESRPPVATEPDSSVVASVCLHAPCCGASVSGQIQAT